MNDNRFSTEDSNQEQSSFVLVSVATESARMEYAPIECLYYQLYQQAKQVHQQPRVTNLFAVMN